MKNIFQNSIRIIISNILSKISNLSILSFLSRLLSQSDFGKYNMFINAGASINQFLELGLNIQNQKFAANTNEQNNKKISNKIGVSISLILIINLLFLLLIILFKKKFISYFFQNYPISNIQLYLLVLLIYFESFNQYFNALIIGFGEFKLYNLKNIIYTLISLFLIIVSTFKFGFLGSIIAYLFATFLNLLISIFFILKIFNNNQIKITFDNFFEELILILKSGFIYYFGNTLFGALFGMTTIILFSKYLNLVDFTYLRFSGALNSLINFLPTSLLPLMLTYLSKSNKSELNFLKFLQLRYFLFFLVFTSLVTITFLKPFINFLFGNSYSSGATIISILILVNLFTQLTNMFSNFLIAEGKMNYVGIISFLSLLILMISMTFFIPKYGINGYLFSYLIIQSISFLLLFLKDDDIDIFDKKNRIIFNFFILTTIIIIFTILIKFYLKNRVIEVFSITLFLSYYLYYFIKYVMNKNEISSIINLKISSK